MVDYADNVDAQTLARTPRGETCRLLATRTAPSPLVSGDTPRPITHRSALSHRAAAVPAVSSRRTPVSEAAAVAASKRKKKSQADSQASEPQAPKAKRPKKEAELEAEDGENGQVVD